MTDYNPDTKEKILETARVLFAGKGFEGTSTREIAKLASVSVSSVNYHFTSKENLFNEILRQGFFKCSNDLRQIHDSSKAGLEDTLVSFFRYFTVNSHDLLSFFKMMMSTQHDRKTIVEGSADGELGPPGGKIISEAIQREVGAPVSDKDLHWALKCLFSHVMHMSIMHNCCFKDNAVPYSSPEDIEESIKRLSKVVLSEIKSLSSSYGKSINE